MALLFGSTREGTAKSLPIIFRAQQIQRLKLGSSLAQCQSSIDYGVNYMFLSLDILQKGSVAG
jgi:hypothetical protein